MVMLPENNLKINLSSAPVMLDGVRNIREQSILLVTSFPNSVMAQLIHQYTYTYKILYSKILLSTN
jgi:hypothetical protein